MKLEKLKPLLASGIVLKHKKFGRLYSISPKESFFVKNTPSTWKKVVLNMPDFLYIVLLPNTDDYKLCTIDILPKKGWKVAK